MLNKGSPYLGRAKVLARVMDPRYAEPALAMKKSQFTYRRLWPVADVFCYLRLPTSPGAPVGGNFPKNSMSISLSSSDGNSSHKRIDKCFTLIGAEDG